MILDPDRIAIREKRILTGMYLSKYSALGLKRLGFQTYEEAYNAVGYALKGKPLSIKNYRDEFDPFFPNSRKGRRNRDIRNYCKKGRWARAARAIIWPPDASMCIATAMVLCAPTRVRLRK